MSKVVIPFLIGFIILAASVGLSGCFEGLTEETNILERFVGTWGLQQQETWYTLQEVNEITFSQVNSYNTDTEMNGDFRIEGEKIILVDNSDNGKESTFKYQFSNDFETLILKDSNGNSGNYKKI